MSRPWTADEIARHPGQKAIENGVEEHPAQAHAPDRTVAEIGGETAAGRRRRERVLMRVRFGDEIGFGLVDRGMVGGMVADVPPGEQAAEHGADARHEEGDAARSRTRR